MLGVHLAILMSTGFK